MMSALQSIVARYGSVILLAALGALGCSKPRTLEEIQAEQSALPALYLTEKTFKQVRAPANAPMFVDKETGEICYPAFECLNPNCPGRSPDGTPQLFINRDVLVSIDPSGGFVWAQIPAGQDPQAYIESLGGHSWPTCPKCLETRNLDSETDAQREQYKQWVRAYELPETTERRKALEVEYEAAFKAREKIRQGG